MTFDFDKQHCLNHWQREAVARCPECSRFFCRECVTEHEDRLLCAGCIGRLGRGEEKFTKRRWMGVFRLIQFFTGFFTLWFLFYYIGRILLLLPDSFHDASLWR